MKKPPVGLPPAKTRNPPDQGHVTQAAQQKSEDEGEISDWDEDEDAYTGMGKQSKTMAGTGGFARRASSIVNVRDRTVGLSNVFAGRDLSESQVHRSVTASQ